MEVHIPFKSRFHEVMLDGTKTWTSRTRKYGHKGDTFDAFGATFEIVKVERRTLKDVGYHFKEEGFSCWKDFYDCWVQIHRRKGWQLEQRVYVHVFKRLGVTAS